MIKLSQLKKAISDSNNSQTRLRYEINSRPTRTDKDEHCIWVYLNGELQNMFWVHLLNDDIKALKRFV